MSSRNERRRSGRGFTLVELMVVVAIMGVIAMLAAPSLRGMVRRLSLGGAMRTLYAGFVDAQSRARTTGIKHRIVLDKAHDQYTIYSVADPSAPVEVAAKKIDSAGKLTFRPAGYPVAFGAPYASVPADSWCTFCGDGATGYVQFDGEGLFDSATDSTQSNGSITLYDSTGATAAVESLVFIGHTGDIRLFRTGT